MAIMKLPARKGFMPRCSAIWNKICFMPVRIPWFMWSARSAAVCATGWYAGSIWKNMIITRDAAH